MRRFLFLTLVLIGVLVPRDALAQVLDPFWAERLGAIERRYGATRAIEYNNINTWGNIGAYFSPSFLNQTTSGWESPELTHYRFEGFGGFSQNGIPSSIQPGGPADIYNMAGSSGFNLPSGVWTTTASGGRVFVANNPVGNMRPISAAQVMAARNVMLGQPLTELEALKLEGTMNAWRGLQIAQNTRQTQAIFKNASQTIQVDALSLKAARGGFASVGAYLRSPSGRIWMGSIAAASFVSGWGEAIATAGAVWGAAETVGPPLGEAVGSFLAAQDAAGVSSRRGKDNWAGNGHGPRGPGSGQGPAAQRTWEDRHPDGGENNGNGGGTTPSPSPNPVPSIPNPDTPDGPTEPTTGGEPGVDPPGGGDPGHTNDPGTGEGAQVGTVGGWSGHCWIEVSFYMGSVPPLGGDAGSCAQPMLVQVVCNAGAGNFNMGGPQLRCN